MRLSVSGFERRQTAGNQDSLSASAFSSIFPDAGCASRPAAQVVEARSSHAASAYKIDELYVGRVQQERALYADLVADAANRERSARAASPGAYDHALEHLRAGTVRLGDSNAYANGVAGRESVYILILLELDKLMGFHSSHILKVRWDGQLALEHCIDTRQTDSSSVCAEAVSYSHSLVLDIYELPLAPLFRNPRFGSECSYSLQYPREFIGMRPIGNFRHGIYHAEILLLPYILSVVE